MKSETHASYKTLKKLRTKELTDLLSEGVLSPDAIETVRNILTQRYLHEVDTGRILKEGQSAENPASLAARLFAKMIDVWGSFLILILLSTFLQDIVPGLRHEISYGAIFVGIVYFLLKDAMSGRSIGKRFCRIVVVQLSNDMPCSKGASFIRNLIGFFGIFDLIFLLFGKERRRLGDLAAGTKVIKYHIQASRSGA
jgi:uncharacterized RDD family membrane protein YckC